MVGVKRTPKSSKKIPKEAKEVTTKKRICKDTENEKNTECLFLKPEVNFNDSNDFKTPERKIGTGRSRLRNQIDYVRLNDPQKKDYSLIRKNAKQSISANTSVESVSVTPPESSRKRARKSSQTKNEDSHLQNVTPSPKPEKIHLSQPKSVKPPSKQLKESKNKVNSKSKTSDFGKKFLEEKSLCNTLTQQISKSRLPKSQNLFDLIQSSDNNASFSGTTICKSPCDPLEIVEKGNSSFISGEQSEISNSSGTYLRNRRKISYKFNIKESRKCVPTVTSSHVSSVSSSHVLSVTSSHATSVTSSHDLSVTSSCIPSVTSSHVPSVASSHIPSVTFSHIPNVSSSIVHFVTSSHVSTITSSHISPFTSSHVPTITSSHISPFTSSHVPIETASRVPLVTSSHVPIETASRVPLVTSSHVPIETASRVPLVTSSHVPTGTSSHVFTEVSSHIPNVTSSHISNGTSSHVFSVTPSHVPAEADSHFSTVTSPLVYAITSPIAPTETGFDHGQNKLKLDNDFTEVQMKVCPTCKDDFPVLLFEEHVLQCLKEQFQSSSHKPFDNKTKHSQISQDEILAHKLHEELNENALTTNDSPESDKILCCICKTDLTCLNSLHRTQHINTCIDQAENAKAPPDTLTQSVVICPMCGQQFKSFSLREMHFKSCGRDKFIAPGQHVIANVHGEPSRLTTNKRQPKNRKTSKSKKAPDDQLELALAMSNSLQEEQNKQEEQLSRCIQNIKKEVLKELKNQKNKQLPLLVTLSDEERQECNAGKVANIMNENFENVSLSKRHKHSSLVSTEPSNLWLKSSLTQADSSKLPFYVNSLMPPIEMDVLNVGSRLKHLSRNTESVINRNTTDSADKETDEQPVAPSQTALILAELANDDEPTNGSMHNPVEDESPNVQKETNEERSTGLLTSLSSDLCQLVNNSSFSDVQFMTADGTKVFGHKIILQIRCPNILNRVSTHLETPTVHLSEVSHDLLIVLLKYIYAGQLNIDETQANNLRMLSQELEMPELFQACEKISKTSVNHNQQSSDFYPSPLKTVDSMIDYLLESSDDDVDNRNICPENPSCDYKILDREEQPQNSQNDDQSTVTKDSAEFQNPTNSSPNVISPSSKVLEKSLNGYSGDNGSNLDYLSNVPVSSQLGSSAQLPEINCDNQPNEPQSNYNTDPLSTDKTDNNPCDVVMTLQKSPSDLTSSQNTPHPPEAEKGFVLNKNVLPSFTSTLPVSTNLTDNSNNNSDNKEQHQLNNAELIEDFSPIHFEDESFNNSPETKSNCDDIATPEKDNLHNNRENVLSLSDDLSNMSKELFSDEELETAENNKTSIQNSFHNQHEFTLSHQIVENIFPCHKENKPGISEPSFSSHEIVSLTKDSDQINNSPNVDNNVADNPVCRIIYTSRSLTSADGSNKELTVPLSLPTETNCNLGEKFGFLNSPAPVFPKTQEVKDINKNLNDDQPETFSQNQNRKRKQSSLSCSPLNRKKTKKDLETEGNSHLTLYKRSSPILDSDNSKLDTSKEVQFSPINSLNSSVNLCNESGSNEVYTVKSETSIITVFNDSYENTHQFKNESDLDISKEAYGDISEINNLQISPKQSNDAESNRESIGSASPEKNSSYENDREIYEESFFADDMNETTYGKAHFSVLNSFIQDNPDLYKKILEYEPVDFGVLKKRLGESNIKCSNKKLLEYLENQCITFILEKNKRSRKSCSPQKRKTVKENLNLEASSNLETVARVEESSEKCSLNSSFNISDELYNDEDRKTKQFDGDVTNEAETADLKKLSPNISNDFCSTKEHQVEPSEKPKKRFVFKKITAKSIICSSTGNKSVDVGNPDSLVKSFTGPSASDKKITNCENLQSNHNVTNDVWGQFSDDNFDDMVPFSPVPSHSNVNLNSSKDKLDLPPAAEQNLAPSSSHDCSYTSMMEDIKNLSCLGSELNCTLSDSFENIDLKGNPEAKFQTPANYREKEQSILSPFTPMPDYDKMTTPGLKKEMKKYGCKARPKKNMIKVLKDIFIRTHQYKSDSEHDTSRDTIKEISETNRFQVSSPEPKDPKTDKESAESISPINISSFENDGVVIYEENYIANEAEEVMSSQQANGEILFSKVNAFIQTNPDFYRKVLQYEPLDFDVLKKTLEESNIKCPANKLLEYLDNQCITFVLNKDKQTKRKPQRGTGRPRRGKKV
ncbi:uncharacterized protein LOC115217132 isoform X2 [Octopus sinensis]|uniref:Structure-specific endonuclease subunit SLX4 n=1 Tax=Octopus sinensis TaxID=2607531 RepID=A0A7E6F5N7_9MOLL|nr:uncharacterized protein LOC115217132 isoform X2 [Octopus sinensis]